MFENTNETNDTDVDFVKAVQGRTETPAREKADLTSQPFPCLYVKSIDADKRQITALASDGSLDRHGDIVLPSAFKKTMPEYMKNPVILACHLHQTDSGHSPVVGNVVSWSIDKKGLWVVIQFAKGTALAEEYWNLYSQKVQRALSVSFRVLESHFESIEGRQVDVITELELYEISCVPIPANRNALSKSKQRKQAFVASKKYDGGVLGSISVLSGFGPGDADKWLEEELALTGETAEEYNERSKKQAEEFALAFAGDDEEFEKMMSSGFDDCQDDLDFAKEIGSQFAKQPEGEFAAMVRCNKS